MASSGYGALKGRRLRATRVDACGRPVFGEASQAVSKGFVEISYTANTVDSDEIRQDNAAGERCLYEPAETSLAGYTVNMTFCEVDPELFSLITNQRVIYDGDGNAIGFAISTSVSLTGAGFALEVWAGAPASDVCDDPNAQGNFGYFLAPFLKGGVLGDFSITNGAINFQITGATTRDGNRWLAGPYNVMLNGALAGPLTTPLEGNDHIQLLWVTVPPPEPFYGTRPVLDPEAAPITAVVATEGTSPTEAAFTFTGAVAGVPVWIDFGDGEWDYVADGTVGSSHVYAANGTFTVRASSNGTWVTTSVTIPFP